MLRKEGGFEQEESHQGSCVDCVDEDFDVVVVAAPQTKDKTKLAGVTEGYYYLSWFDFNFHTKQSKKKTIRRISKATLAQFCIPELHCDSFVTQN